MTSSPPAPHSTNDQLSPIRSSRPADAIGGFSITLPPAQAAGTVLAVRAITAGGISGSRNIAVTQAARLFWLDLFREVRDHVVDDLADARVP